MCVFLWVVFLGWGGYPGARWMGMCVNLSVFRELLFKFTHIVFLGNIGQFRVETLNPPPV